MRVAVLSFLFNWPSTGGGNHHTAELAKFLALDGYDVKHYFARYPGWGIGQVTDELISPSEAIEFDESTWNVADIQARFRGAVDAFDPDYVIITDSWNMKPLLAEAVRGYPYSCSTRRRKISARSITCDCWQPGRTESNSARATNLPRPKSAAAAWPNAGAIPGAPPGRTRAGRGRHAGI